ncbi:MAG: hypothetical protein BGO30_07610 [Bacteroidetes bacterium 41-46]|nr:MAG: hypothetical protein BGO30_07610 [Bacteroidetes bacterium 41-46]
MINFDALLKKKGVTKTEVALRLGVDRANLYRTLGRYQKLLTEIDDFLKNLGTSLKDELSSDVSSAYFQGEREERLVEEKNINDNYQKLYLDALSLVQKQAGTIISQQETIEKLVEVSKKAKSA